MLTMKLLLLIEITQVVHYANQEQYKPIISFNEILKIIREESKYGVVLFYVENILVVPNNLLFKGTVYEAYSPNCSDKLKM